MNERAAGRFTSSGTILFAYSPAWLSEHGDYPLSLSMPVASRTYEAPARAFLENLLPENPAVLERLGRAHSVSPRNPMALLAVIGEDCPGAINFISENRSPGDFRTLLQHGQDLLTLTERDVAERLRLLREDRAFSGRMGDDPGHFSLPGAQQKMAVHALPDGRFAIPGGRIPTTTILKPPMPGLAGQVENEHFCLELAHEIGLPAARSTVMQFENELAIAVDRYDRLRGADGHVMRLHQEDMCQALGVGPDRKYQRDGGPGISAIIRNVLSQTHGREDAMVFMKAAMLNTMIAGTDAHAKNYSTLISPGNISLAPLYDINSLLPYPEFSRRSRMSMSVGGHYEQHAIMPRHWEREAQRSGLPPEQVRLALSEMAEILPDAAATVLARARADGLTTPILTTLTDAVALQATRIKAALAIDTPSTDESTPSPTP